MHGSPLLENLLGILNLISISTVALLAGKESGDPGCTADWTVPL